MSEEISNPIEPTTAPATLEVGPVQQQERIEVIDILRGFAVFGILLVNLMFFFNTPPTLHMTGFQWPGPANRIVEKATEFFAMGKFYTLFSFLFGLGFSVQLMRGEARGVNVVPIYRRRLFVLFLFGLVHGLLIWFGDILSTYALVGFFLLLFRKRKQKTLIVWAIICFSISMILPMVRSTVVQIQRSNPEKEKKATEKMKKERAEWKTEAEENIRIYSSGTYRDLMEQRVLDFSRNLSFAVIFCSQFLGIFLIGLYVGRRGLFQNISEELPFLDTVLRWGLPIGVIGNVIWIISNEYSDFLRADLLWGIGNSIYGIAVPALSFSYIAGIILLVQNESWRRRLAPLSYVGRMALSNYLTHSVVCTLLFYSYGFGLYGKITPVQNLLIALMIYPLQIPISKWWLSRYQFGPAEWLWRSLTYGKFQPMRKPGMDQKGKENDYKDTL